MRPLSLRPSTLVSVFTVLSAMLVFSAGAHAQSASATGRLEGIVSDTSGAAVPHAEITVRNQNTCVSTTQQSTAGGEFTFLYLDPGTYSVSIQKPGFNKLLLKDVTVTVGTRAILHPQLMVGRVE